MSFAIITIKAKSTKACKFANQLKGLSMGSKLDIAKLFLVCYPSERKVSAIALMIECSESTVRVAMSQLNINPIKRPRDCRG